MNICGEYSHNNGLGVLEREYTALLREIRNIISGISASQCKTDNSKGTSMSAFLRYSRSRLNTAFQEQFIKHGWESQKVTCDYSALFYGRNYRLGPLDKSGFREMDFVKDGLAVDVHLADPALPIYSGCAKMTIFHRLGFIDTGVEVVPIKNFADEMSTGVSYFEQFVWDLEKRGVSDIDIPVLILGIDK